MSTDQEREVAVAIGRGITVVLSLALIVWGITVSLTSPDLSGGTFVGAGLVALGGALIVRIVQVTR